MSGSARENSDPGSSVLSLRHLAAPKPASTAAYVTRGHAATPAWAASAHHVARGGAGGYVEHEQRNASIGASALQAELQQLISAHNSDRSSKVRMFLCRCCVVKVMQHVFAKLSLAWLIAHAPPICMQASYRSAATGSNASAVRRSDASHTLVLPVSVKRVSPRRTTPVARAQFEAQYVQHRHTSQQSAAVNDAVYRALQSPVAAESEPASAHVHTSRAPSVPRHLASGMACAPAHTTQANRARAAAAGEESPRPLLVQPLAASQMSMVGSSDQDAERTELRTSSMLSANSRNILDRLAADSTLNSATRIKASLPSTVLSCRASAASAQARNVSTQRLISSGQRHVPAHLQPVEAAAPANFAIQARGGGERTAYLHCREVSFASAAGPAEQCTEPARLAQASVVERQLEAPRSREQECRAAAASQGRYHRAAPGHAFPTIAATSDWRRQHSARRGEHERVCSCSPPAAGVTPRASGGLRVPAPRGSVAKAVLRCDSQQAGSALGDEQHNSHSHAHASLQPRGAVRSLGRWKGCISDRSESSATTELHSVGGELARESSDGSSTKQTLKWWRKRSGLQLRRLDHCSTHTEMLSLREPSQSNAQETARNPGHLRSEDAAVPVYGGGGEHGNGLLGGLKAPLAGHEPVGAVLVGEWVVQHAMRGALAPDADSDSACNSELA